MVEGSELDCVSPDRSSAELMQLRQRLGERAAALRRAAEHYSLLAGETRLKIIHLLSTAGELCVCDLATVLEMTPAAVSQHLTRLRAGRMVASRRDGMTIYYRLTEPAAAALTGDLNAVSGSSER